MRWTAPLLVTGALWAALAIGACSAGGDTAASSGTSGGGGACACTPGEENGCIDANNVSRCADDCSGFEAVSCGPSAGCDASAQTCAPLSCTPNLTVCVDEKQFHTCNAEGDGFGTPETCPTGQDCVGGECVEPCAGAAAQKSNIGCEFWAVDMSNDPPKDTYVFAVAVANPSQVSPVDVTIYDKNGGTEQTLLSGTIQPRQVEVFNLSGSVDGVTGHYSGDAGFIGNGIAQGRAFRVETSRPVLATQFNPISSSPGRSTDASLLLPTHTIGTSYIHLAYDRGFGDGSAMVVVATEDDTTVTLTPSTATTAGGGLPAMTAGVETTIALDRYDYMQLGVSTQGLDLSGSRIRADKPVAVFGGHSCAYVPSDNTDFCDHVEEQIFPLGTWGTNYIAARNPPRGSEPMVWRVVGAVDGTSVTFDPPVSLGSQVTVDAGEVLQFEDDGDFAVSASEPVLLAGFMTGCRSVSPAGDCPGDPYMTLMVPTAQYLADYVFLIDDTYDADFAKLIRPAGATVNVGCAGVVPDDRWTAVGSSGYETAVVDMNPGEGTCAPGTHEASGNQGFGIVISGQGFAASYGYPGGLALEEINLLK